MASITYMTAEKYPEAVLDFNKAIELKPNKSLTYLRRAIAYMNMHKLENSLSDFNKAAELSPDEEEYYYCLSILNLVLDKPELAMNCINRALELRPQYPEALIHRGRLKVFYEDFDGALADFEYAIKLDKNAKKIDAEPRGTLLSYLGRYTESVKDLEQAVNKSPRDNLAFYRLVIVQYKLEGLTKNVLDLINKSHNLIRNELKANKERATFDDSASQLLDEVIIRENGMALYCLGGLEAIRENFAKALDYLEQAISLNKNVIQWARHDPAWLKLQADLRFQSITSSIV
jgi:tetratricopeptide (TPR) repeat protein